MPGQVLRAGASELGDALEAVLTDTVPADPTQLARSASPLAGLVRLNMPCGVQAQLCREVSPTLLPPAEHEQRQLLSG
jgi:hypothetical protein